jgi:MoaA/NifB/PqqE/SkfB family radical SAM enzyme
MKKVDLFKAWGRILSGRYPSLSIEITRECPLRCPGCYAYEPEHLLGTGQTLRTVADYKGDELVEKVLAIVRKYKPIHVSIVGGEPLVRYRELSILLPKLSGMGIAVQVVTSAVREIPPDWNEIDELYLSVSIDGLQPEHDQRRKPATYERILRHIAGHRVTVHCTVTSQMTRREDYLEEFVSFWSEKAGVKKIWFSLFTPQLGAADEEILDPATRKFVIDKLEELQPRYPKLELPRSVIEGFRDPPKGPSDCMFSRTTLNLTANLEDRVVPCQFGGSPDCSQCGCFASAGLAAVGRHKVLGIVPIRRIHDVSDRIGRTLNPKALNV